MRVFIWIMGLGAFALLLLFSLITGNYINWNWALPCFFLTGMILVVLFRPNINKKKAPLPENEEFKNIKDKFSKYFSDKPGK